MHDHLGQPVRRLLTPLVFLVMGVLAGTCLSLTHPPTASAATTGSFATRCGIRFCLDGEEYYFAGANAYDLFTHRRPSGAHA